VLYPEFLDCLIAVVHFVDPNPFVPFFERVERVIVGMLIPGLKSFCEGYSGGAAFVAALDKAMPPKAILRVAMTAPKRTSARRGSRSSILASRRATEKTPDISSAISPGSLPEKLDKTQQVPKGVPTRTADKSEVDRISRSPPVETKTEKGLILPQKTKQRRGSFRDNVDSKTKGRDPKGKRGQAESSNHAP